MGKDFEKISTYISESLCCTFETNTTLLINWSRKVLAI